MNKKIMKRSLALGALMAFVITGSAVAADYEERQVIYGGDFDGKSFTVETVAGGNFGGAIQNGNGTQAGTLTISGCKFEKNSITSKNASTVHGGALYNWGGTVIITDTDFIGNKTKNERTDSYGKNGQGGAIYNNGGSMTITGGSIRDNVAEGTNSVGDPLYAMGGAIYNGNGGVLTVDTVTFENNKGCEGGAIVTNSSGLTTIKNSDFISNTATMTGGALNVQGTRVMKLEGTNTFTNNVAVQKGGAVRIQQGGVLEINGNATFTGNTANGVANDIHNDGIVNINSSDTYVVFDGGMTGSGTTNINGGNLVLKGGTTYVETLGGDGGVIRFESADAKLEVNTNNNDALKFTASGAVNEAVAGDANKLISNVDYADDTTMVMDAGDVVGEVSAKLVKNAVTGKLMVEEGSVTEKINPANQAISDAGVGLKLHYRYHMNDMNKRMGELRNANGEHGVWTRMVRGESEYDNSKAQYNQYQLGYDEKLSVDKRWTVGAAVTFSEGDSSYGYGSTEDKSTAFAIYGSKLNNDGTFVDLIARYAHLESDIEDKVGKGDYSTNGMSVSAEFGKRIQQGNGLWIEPQFELTYGTIDSAEFQIGGKTVQVGDMDSLIGRVGFSLGKDIKQGNVYARASYLYDFDGETETAFSNASATRTFKDDLGGGWWEVGVGANINLSKATYVYADVEKTFGGEVDTNWQWNLGVRYSF